jgi:hypothetical protein
MLKSRYKLFFILGLAAFVLFWLMKAPVISSYVTRKMGVTVAIGSVSIGSRETKMSHFRILNTPGFGSREAFKADRIHIVYRFGKLRSSPSEIDEIVLDDVYLNIELHSSNRSDNNWTAIGNAMPKLRDHHPVVIHKLIIKNLTVETQGKGAKLLGVAGTRRFNQMEFNEINSQEGFPTKELIDRIFKDAGIWKYIENLLNPVQDLRKKLNPINIFGENKTLE